MLFNKNSMLTSQEIDQHQQSWNECTNWVNQNQREGIRFLPVYTEELPDLLGGVGWARKLAMDEAARRLDSQGIMVCLDADCIVSPNYLEAIFQHFQEFRTYDSASIFIEHKLEHLNALHRDAIIQYELHLRYLIHAQQWCGHPFATHTIGSAMAVRRQAYLKQGGMNTRRAGEDFYFLQKFIEAGSHMEITNTTIYPSARISSRVPFGTGKAMMQILMDHEKWTTTDFEIFNSIKPLFQSLHALRNICLRMPHKDDYHTIQHEFGLSDFIIIYLEQMEFLDECREVARQTASHAAFRKRFFRYFNAFRMIKYMHHMSDHHYPEIPVIEGVAKLAKGMKWNEPSGLNLYEYLIRFRQIDRERSS